MNFANAECFVCCSGEMETSKNEPLLIEAVVKGNNILMSLSLKIAACMPETDACQLSTFIF